MPRTRSVPSTRYPRTPITGKSHSDREKDKRNIKKVLNAIVDSAVNIECEANLFDDVTFIITQVDGKQQHITVAEKSEVQLNM